MHASPVHEFNVQPAAVTNPDSSSSLEPVRPTPRYTAWFVASGALVVVLAAYLVWTFRTGVDPRVVGRWDRDMSNRSGVWRARFTIGRDQKYSIETVVNDRGRIVASAGHYRMISTTHTSAVGTYRVLNPTSLEVTSAAGKVIWKRQGGASAMPGGDPMLGVWEASPVIGGVTWHQTISAAADSSYTLSSTSGDSGHIHASAGQFHMVSHGGREADGTYSFATLGQLTFVAPEGRSVWRRDTTKSK